MAETREHTVPSIDLLTPKRSLIDLSVPTEGSFDSAIIGYQMCRLMEDVILCKYKDEYVEVGDHICFPNNLGIPISNLEVEGLGKLRKGIFLNESRIFGIVKPFENK